MEYIVYVKVNESGYITAVNSSAFLADVTGWVEIDRGYGDKYHHAQGNYFPEPIIIMGGAYRYKLVAGEVKMCTEEEIKENSKELSTFESRGLELRVTELENSSMQIRQALEAVLNKIA